MDELNYFVYPLPRPAQLCTLDPPGLRKKRLWSAAAAVGRVFDLPTSSHLQPPLGIDSANIAKYSQPTVALRWFLHLL